MILNGEHNEVQSNVDGGIDFSVECNESIFDTLSNRLYKEPKRAVVRELVSNGIDANIDAGKHEQIKLHLPTSLDPTFYVEDHGIGMDDATIKDVYTHYGKSTKNGSNDCIGGLGLGSKTPFACTSQFFVESAKDGIKNTYICFKDEMGKPHANKTDSQPVDASVTGTKVSFPVKESDCDAYAKEAVITLMFTKEMPLVVGNVDAFLHYAGVSSFEEFDELRDIIKNNTFIDDERIYEHFRWGSYGTLLAEMGGVVYSIDANAIMEDHCDILRYIRSKSKVQVLHIPIGSVAIQASREALSYIPVTKNFLTRTIVNLFTEEVLQASVA